MGLAAGCVQAQRVQVPGPERGAGPAPVTGSSVRSQHERLPYQGALLPAVAPRLDVHALPRPPAPHTRGGLLPPLYPLTGTAPGGSFPGERGTTCPFRYGPLWFTLGGGRILLSLHSSRVRALCYHPGEGEASVLPAERTLLALCYSALYHRSGPFSDRQLDPAVLGCRCLGGCTLQGSPGLCASKGDWESDWERLYDSAAGPPQAHHRALLMSLPTQGTRCQQLVRQVRGRCTHTREY